jgi:hypothetical protein
VPPVTQPWSILRAIVLARPGAAERVARLRREAEAAPPGVTCTECGRQHRGGERWHVYFVDIGEVAIYCPGCASGEFGADPGLTTET